MLDHDSGIARGKPHYLLTTYYTLYPNVLLPLLNQITGAHEEEAEAEDDNSGFDIRADEKPAAGQPQVKPTEAAEGGEAKQETPFKKPQDIRIPKRAWVRFQAGRACKINTETMDDCEAVSVQMGFPILE